MSLACGLAVGRDTPYFIPKLDRALDINKEENGKNKKKKRDNDNFGWRSKA